MQCYYWLATISCLVARSKSPSSPASSLLVPSSTPIYSVIWHLLSLIWTRSQLSSRVRLTRLIQPWRTWNYLKRSRIESYPTYNTSNRHSTIRMNLVSSSGWSVPRSRRRWRASSSLNSWSKTWSLLSILKSKTTWSRKSSWWWASLKRSKFSKARLHMTSSLSRRVSVSASSRMSTGRSGSFARSTLASTSVR